MLFLFIGALLSAAASLAHIGCIIFGAKWYLFFGAGKKMAQWADDGNAKHVFITLPIVVVLAVWSVYALSAAGLISRLPLTKWALITITTIYLLRGLYGFYFAHKPNGENSAKFWFYSSLICLGFGAVHLIGLIQVWQNIWRHVRRQSMVKPFKHDLFGIRNWLECIEKCINVSIKFSFEYCNRHV